MVKLISVKSFCHFLSFVKILRVIVGFLFTVVKMDDSIFKYVGFILIQSLCVES